MDKPVYIFVILINVYIVYIIFSIYFYVIFRYFLHGIERNAIIHFFNKHVDFYKPVIKLTKEYSKTNVEEVIQSLQKEITNSKAIDESSDFTVGTIVLVTSISILSIIVIVYFYIYYKEITAQITLMSIISTFILNFILIIGGELTFLYIVYSNIDVINIQKILNIQ